jgi:integrase
MWTVLSWAEEWLKRVDERVRFGQLRPPTAKLYRAFIEHHLRQTTLAARGLAEIRRSDLKTWARDLMAAGAAPASLRTWVCVMRAMFSEAVEDEILAANPAASLIRSLRLGKSVRQRRSLTLDELAAVLVPLRPTRSYPTVLVMLCLGLRVGEALALQWEDIDWDGHGAHVRHQLYRDGTLTTPKAGHLRRVDVPALLLEEMRRWRTTQRGEALRDGLPPGPWVLGEPPTNAMAARSRLRRACDSAAKNAGLERLSPHMMRHTFATTHKGLGRNMKWLQEQLGHADIRTTSETYAGEQPTTDRSAADELGEVIRGAQMGLFRRPRK